MLSYEGGSLPGPSTDDINMNAAYLAVSQIPELDGLTSPDREDALYLVAELVKAHRIEGTFVAVGGKWATERIITIEDTDSRAIMLIGTRQENDGIDSYFLWIGEEEVDEVLADEGLIRG